jgi:hypothetical protein
VQALIIRWPMLGFGADCAALLKREIAAEIPHRFYVAV